MDSLAPKYRSTVKEAVAHLINRAENSRGLEIDDLHPRVVSALNKYLLRDEPNAQSAEIMEFVEEIRVDDLCLIIACEKGDETAWGDLVLNFDSTVKSAAYKFCKNKEDAEDLGSSIWAELHGLRLDKEGNKKSKLAYYSGRGSLAGWLRAVTNQLAIDQFRKMKRIVQTEDDREFENLAQDSSEKSDFKSVVSISENPEEIFSEQEATADVAEALKDSIAELEPEDRLILKLYYFDDLNLKISAKCLVFTKRRRAEKSCAFKLRSENWSRKICEKNIIGTKLRSNATYPIQHQNSE